MKSIFIFIFSIVLLCNCSAQSDEITQINYDAVTRGSSIHLKVNATKIEFKNSNENKTISLSKEQWKEIDNLVSEIELESIETFDAPSSDHQTDRALIATITIIKNGKEFESSVFDHGNPPEKLKELVDKLFEFVDLK